MTTPGTAFEVTVVQAPAQFCADIEAALPLLAERFPIGVGAMGPETDGGRAEVEPLRPATNLSVLLDGSYLDLTREHGVRLEKAILAALRTAMAAGRPEPL